MAQEGCFEAQPPSCETNTTSTSENAQDVCFILDSEYLFEDYLNLTTHANLLNSIPADSELCRQAQLVYHECFWCNQNSWCFKGGHFCDAPQVIVLNSTTTILQKFVITCKVCLMLDSGWLLQKYAIKRNKHCISATFVH